jgi:hypothetical protein
MAERERYPLKELSFQQQKRKLAPFVDAIGDIIYCGPMREDPRAVACGMAELELIGDEYNGQEFRERLISADVFRRERLSMTGRYNPADRAYNVQLSIRAIMKQLSKPEPEQKDNRAATGPLVVPGYEWPEDFVTTLPWKLAIYDIVNDPRRQDEFLWDLVYNEINSTVIERYLGSLVPIGLIQLCDGRLKGDISWLDKGASANHALKQVSLGIPIKNAKYGWRAKGEGGKDKFIIDEELTEYLGRFATGNHVKLKMGIGLDRFDVTNDPNAKLWVEVSSHWPSERTKERIAAYRVLDAANPPNVKFIHAHMDDPDITKLPGLAPQSFNVVTTNTALYMQPESAQEASFKNDQELLTPDGIALREDFLKVVDGKLVTCQQINRRDWEYTATMTDMLDSKRRTVPLIYWRTGRAREGQLAEAAISMLAEAGVVHSKELNARAQAIKLKQRGSKPRRLT